MRWDSNERATCGTDNKLAPSLAPDALVSGLATFARAAKKLPKVAKPLTKASGARLACARHTSSSRGGI